ncbi:50S ribosomal protein L15 [bacterium MnTg02]|nr:50S ribosomal protein L15 [bacterium MnTg02]
MRLNELRDNPGATRSRKRVGRGPGSGKGTTAGRGDKGQKSRSGVALKGFEGGQMPIHRRLPKRGFNNIFRKDFNEINLGRLQAVVDNGQIDAKLPVTAAALAKAGIISKIRDGVRVLGNGELKTALTLEVSGISESAKKAVEAAGGSVTLVKALKRAAEAPAVEKKAKSGKASEKVAAKSAKKAKAADRKDKDKG